MAKKKLDAKKKKADKKKKQEEPQKSPEKRPVDPAGPLGGLPSLRKPGDFTQANKISELADMKKNAKDILAMASNLKVAGTEKEVEEEEEKKDPFAEGQKVGGLFSSKAGAAGSGSGMTSLNQNMNTAIPPPNEKAERKKRLQAQRDLIVKAKKAKMDKELEVARTQKTDNVFTNKRFEEFKQLDANIKRTPALFTKDVPAPKGSEDESASVMGKLTAGMKKDMSSLFGAKTPEQLKKEEQMRKLEEQRQKTQNSGQKKAPGIMNIESTDVIDF